MDTSEILPTTNPLKIASASGKPSAVRPIFRNLFAVLVAGFIGFNLPVADSLAQPANNDDAGAEVVTRGPVHEAFAGVVSYNPEPGIVVTTPPPELIEEIPPEEKPEGDDVAWIPGYWAWDDERNDYLWISGTWRALPPGREWIAGYWRDTGQGYQWISGYWADTTEQETTYLPPPPATLEVGANVDAPSDDYGWTPGCWIWIEGRYAWRAGYWTEGRADWVWVPSYYVWTPRGVIFVEGFWDYPVVRRGLLFAPVYYQTRGYARRDYSYSPRIVISLSIFDDCLFLRPRYHHYYFGDYYDSRYDRSGFYASFSFQSTRHGYDPFYSHSRWEHRRERDWDNRFRESYKYRRENEAARPPRTWAAAQVNVNIRTTSDTRTRVAIAAPIEELAKRKDNSVRIQSVDRGERQRLSQRGREVQKTRDERRSIEAKAVITTESNTRVATEPAKVAAPKSPIVARPSEPSGKNQAPPAKPQAPRPETKGQPKSTAPVRQSNPNRRDSPAETRQREPEGKAPSARDADVSRDPKERPANADTAKAQKEESQRITKESQLKARDDDEKRVRVESDSAAKSQRQSEERSKARDESLQQQKAKESTQKAREESGERAKAKATNAREESQQKASAAAENVREDAEKRNRDAVARALAAEKSRKNANEEEATARQEAEERRNAAAAKAQEEQAKAQQQARARQDDAEERAKASAMKGQEESQRRAQEAQAQAKANQDAARRANEAPVRPKPAPRPKPDRDEDDDGKKDKDNGKSRGG